MGHLGVEWERLSLFLSKVNDRFPLAEAILFGSRARGDELYESDYDLILVSPAFRWVPWTQRVASVLELWDMDVPVEPMCYTPEEFAKKSGEHCSTAQAVQEGIKLAGGEAVRSMMTPRRGNS